MKGLLIKDLINLKKSFGTIIAMIVLYFLFAYQSGDPSILVGMIVFLLTMMSITSMSYDDMAKWDKFALSMPISRKTIVYSKYILAVLLSLAGLVLSTGIGYIVILLKAKMSIQEYLVASYAIFVLSMAFICIIIPLIFKFGVEKSRLMMMGAIIIPMIIGYVISKSGISMPSENQLMTILKLSPLLVVLALYISSTISYNIYKKKDL
ncbi:ABC-2 transporter permease [Paratissierella segnis]|uniref:ABC-2 transporter permease n=1 Tax=Paratissierella segnis TaxID=2763679 RepID=A0A926ESK4_9FIRM|nr:ABC-2 transporter permease [Paratissierella segnis]MBC8586881.1 ABC-2 transporter permease [Paratissierella segnis]